MKYVSSRVNCGLEQRRTREVGGEWERPSSCSKPELPDDDDDDDDDSGGGYDDHYDDNEWSTTALVKFSGPRHYSPMQ